MRDKKYTLASTRKLKGKLKLIKYYRTHYSRKYSKRYILEDLFKRSDYNGIMRRIRLANIPGRKMIPIHEDHFNAKIFLLVTPSHYCKLEFYIISFVDQNAKVYASFCFTKSNKHDKHYNVKLLNANKKLEIYEIFYLKYIVKANILVLKSINEMKEKDANEVLYNSQSYFLKNARNLIKEEKLFVPTNLYDLEKNFTKLSY